MDEPSGPGSRLSATSRWSVVGTLTGVFALVVAVEPVAAHELGRTRFDAPLPLPLLYLGAGLTVAATAGWLARTDARPHPDTETDAETLARQPTRMLATIPAGTWDRLRTAASLGFLLAFLAVIVAGLTGPQVQAENVATVFTWPLWLKGIGLLAAVAGSPWRVLSPWRTLYRLLSRLEGEPLAVLDSYPSWLGTWPALVGYLVWLGVIENLTTIPRSPRATVALLAGYAVVMLVGAIAVGEEWFDRADALSVLYRLFGRVAPLQLSRTGDTYAVTLRPPWRGCLTPADGRATSWFIVATVYTVSFDGFTSTATFQTVFFGVRDVLPTGPLTGPLVYVLGFACFLVAFAAVARAAERAGATAGKATLDESLTRTLAPTVLPIAVAYEVAHNYAFVLSSLGPFTAAALSSVLAAPPSPDVLGWLPLSVFWGTQVVLVVAGHVVAVVAAHRVTRRLFPAGRAPTRAHVPITALMVAYTMVSLWITSQPIVQ